MALARFQRTLTDAAGNVPTENITVTVKRRVAGLPLARPFSDREGTNFLGSTFVIPPSENGLVGFHVIGGVYQITAAVAGHDPVVWDWVGIGTAQEQDAEDYSTAGFTWGLEAGTAAPPSTGFMRANNGDWSLATRFYINKTTLGGSAVAAWLLAFSAGDDLYLATGAGTELGMTVVSVTNQTNHIDIQFSNYVGPAGPLNLADTGVATLGKGRRGAAGTNGTNGTNGSNGANGIDGAGIFSRVRAVATSSITISTALNNGDSLDGVVLATNDLVLVAGQTSPAQNGVYVVGVTPVRDTAFDTYDEHPGAYVAVMEGAANADTLWRCTSDKGGTLGTTTIVFSQFRTGRELLSANRDIFVGFNLGAVAISIASPAVVTKNAHGLVADSRVSFAILPNHKTATISVASPAVVTMANSFAAGQPVKFLTTGRLPSGITPGTTYYVIAAGLSGSSFRISATVGGSAIITTAPTVTISNASPGVVTLTSHGLAVGDPVQFATTGALPTGLAAATTYFVKTVPNANTFTVSATPEGAAINTSSAGSGTHTLVQFGAHELSETGALPTGVTEGQDYYVLATGLTANSFRFSATSGGAAINSSGSTTGTITATTGNDAASGLTATAADALLTLQRAHDIASEAIDQGSQAVAINLADGVFTGGVQLRAYVGRGAITTKGNPTFPGNTVISPADTCFNGNFVNGRWFVQDVELRSSAGNAMNMEGAGYLGFAGVRFGTCANAHVRGVQGAMLEATGPYTVVGGAAFHLLTGWLCTISVGGKTITFLSGSNFSLGVLYADALSFIPFISNTFVGKEQVKGTRYYAGVNAFVNGGGGGATYVPGSVAGGVSPLGGQYV